MISKYVSDNFNGMLLFGDVHGDYGSFEYAYNFARKENLFFMSMGDLVDRGRQPFAVVKAMYDCITAGLGGFVIGNHDEKHYRASRGAKVIFSRDAKQTIEDVGPQRKDEFSRMYAAIIEDPALSGLFHKFGNITLVHAASHPSLWEECAEFGKTARSRFLVGETNGERYDDGYPVRLYNWIDEIPANEIVIVGHDKQPIHNIPIDEPMTVVNENNGKAIFLDTGCGKGGFLSGAIVLHNKEGFVIDQFVEF